MMMPCCLLSYYQEKFILLKVLKLLLCLCHSLCISHSLFNNLFIVTSQRLLVLLIVSFAVYFVDLGLSYLLASTEDEYAASNAIQILV